MDKPVVHQKILSHKGIAINNTGEFIVHGDITQVNNLYQLPEPPTAEEQAQLWQRAQAHLATMPTAEIPLATTLPAGSRMPFKANPLFVGREPELRQLAQATKVDDERVMAITGMGGMGKSQVALAFAHRYGQYFAGGVYWVSLAEAASVANEVAQCGGIHLHPGFGELPVPDQVRLVRQSWQDDLPRLLIFDNCESEHLLAEWLPPTGGARVLVTSRKGDWGPELGVQTVPLSTLDRAQSITLLRQLAPIFAAAEWDASLDELAEEVGDFPLALHLAGSYLGKYGERLPPAKLTVRLQSEGLKGRVLQTHARNGVSPTGHAWAVARTFELSFTQLDTADEIDKMALALLARAVWFAPGEPLAEDLLFLTVGDEEADDIDPLLLLDGIVRLVDLGLLARVAETDAVQLHRLLGQYVKDELGEEVARPSQNAVEQALVKEANRLNQEGYPRALQAWVTHLQYVTDKALPRRDEQAVSLCNELGYHLQWAGYHRAARPYYEQGLVISREVFGERGLQVAKSYSNLGLLLVSMGEYEEARPCYEEAIAIQKQSKIFAQHPDMAVYLNNLGLLLMNMGHYEEARPYYDEALTITRRMLGEQHPYTALMLNNLGGVLDNLGQVEEARVYYEQALAIRREILGEGHPDIAQSLNNLGLLLNKVGLYEEARVYYEQALAIRREALGDQHHETAQSLNNLGLLLSNMGQVEEARPCYEEALAIYRQMLGEEHPDTGVSYGNLAGVLQRTGDLAQAKVAYEKALSIHRASLGDMHPLTAQSFSNLGWFLCAVEQYEEAVPCFEQALAIRWEMLGEMHPQTVNSLSNLAELLSSLARYEEALPYYAQDLAIRRELLGEWHPDTAQGLNDLGALLYRAGRYEEARPCYEEAIVIRREVLGEWHPDTAGSLNNLAWLCASEGDLTTAVELMAQAVAIWEETLGADHPNTQASRNNLAQFRAEA